MSEFSITKKNFNETENVIPSSPGIYKFLDSRKVPIYIGKSKDLKKRVKSYFQKNKNINPKIESIKEEAAYIDLTLTRSELEALLLEQHLIKDIKPKFNVQFKDDKGYPWIQIDSSKDFPSARSFLGKTDIKAKYYGPYPSSYSVREVLHIIQKVFKLRDCKDSFFKNRSRPCLQYEIGRCSAPCVGAISKREYLEDVRSAEMLLQGKANSALKKLYKLMDRSSEKYLYEKAASYRDKISSLREVQRSQSITGYRTDVDAVSFFSLGSSSRIGITLVRGGWIIGHKNYLIENLESEEEVIEAFLLDYYLSGKEIPSKIIVENKIKNLSNIKEIISKKAKKKILISHNPQAKNKGLLEICRSNTQAFLLKQKNKKNSYQTSFQSLSLLLERKSPLKHIESYDVSHHSGENALAGSVSYKLDGKDKNLYRTYNLDSSIAGNDIGSIKEVLTRRFKNSEDNLNPDVLIVDGGKIHLKTARKVLDSLKIKDVDIISISKRTRRKPSFDYIHKEKGESIKINRHSLSHLLIQEIRDETHRFAISRQRKKHETCERAPADHEEEEVEKSEDAEESKDKKN